MRRAGFAVLTMSMAAAACGRIVTVPKAGASGQVPAGNMLIRYRVLGVLDFQNLRYVVDFNTNGNGQTPSAPNIATYTNYSFILIFGGTQASGAAYAVAQVVNSGSGGFTSVVLPQAPQYVTNFNPNSSGNNNEFTFTFNRFLLSPLQSATPTPAPSPTPVGIPTLLSGVSSLWAINMFSEDASNNPSPIDAISSNGVSDTTFNSFVVNTLVPFDVVSNKPVPPPVQVANPNAQIIAAEVINTP
jgi:hypothetical protein